MSFFEKRGIDLKKHYIIHFLSVRLRRGAPHHYALIFIYTCGRVQTIMQWFLHLGENIAKRVRKIGRSFLRILFLYFWGCFGFLYFWIFGFLYFCRFSIFFNKYYKNKYKNILYNYKHDFRF